MAFSTLFTRAHYKVSTFLARQIQISVKLLLTLGGVGADDASVTV